MTEQAGEQAKMDWPEMYAAGFEVLREGPSLVTAKLVELLGPEQVAAGRALDVGCGKLRNSVYLAEYGAEVEAIDEADHSYVLATIDPAARQRIHLETGRVQDHDFEPETFDAVVCTRLIQYLPPEDSERLLTSLAGAIRRGGGLALNYTVMGGLVGDERAPTQTFSHSPDDVRHLLKAGGLSVRSYVVGEGLSSVRVPCFEGSGEKLLTCDIVAVKQ